jgi:1-acyl-sn-glycerol-3-phosphate acyltransferase
MPFEIFFRKLISLILRLTSRIDLIGIENVPAEGKCILAANHIGRLDATLVYHLIDRRDIILTPAEKYSKVAFFRWAAKSLNAIFLDRFNPDIGTLRAVMKRLQNGGLLAIAPEGTRSKSETLIDGQPGTAYLAAKTRAPILAVALMGTEDRRVLENLRKLRRSSVRVVIGKPFLLPPLDAKKRDEQLHQSTEEIMCQIAALLPNSYHGVYADNPRIAAIRSEIEKTQMTTDEC